MAEHRNLTGNDLHEPKGVENASTGQVYVANGNGSGNWTDRFTGFLNLNRFFLSGVIPNVSAANSAAFVALPSKASLNRMHAVLGGTITAAPAVLTLYKNGVAQDQVVTIASVGSGPGVKTTVTFNPAISFNEGDVLEVRTDGASDGDFPLTLSLVFSAAA